MITTKKVYYIPILLVLLNSLLLTPTLAGVVSWDIDTGFGFYGTDTTSGRIEFASSATSTQITQTGGYTYFSDLSLGAYAFSSLGFDCTSNSAISISTIAANNLIYTITAAAAQESTSRVVLPAGTSLASSTGPDTITVSGQVLTILVTHSSPETINLILEPTPSISNSFSTTIELWNGLSQLIFLFLAVLGLNSVYTGNTEHIYQIISLAVGTAALIIILSIVEGLA